MTKEQQAIADRHIALTKGALSLAALLTSDPTEQAAVLLAAATSIIERQVGKAMANEALAALLEPTIMDWLAPADGAARH